MSSDQFRVQHFAKPFLYFDILTLLSILYFGYLSIISLLESKYGFLQIFLLLFYIIRLLNILIDSSSLNILFLYS